SAPARACLDNGRCQHVPQSPWEAWWSALRAKTSPEECATAVERKLLQRNICVGYGVWENGYRTSRCDAVCPARLSLSPSRCGSLPDTGGAVGRGDALV